MKNKKSVIIVISLLAFQLSSLFLCSASASGIEVGSYAIWTIESDDLEVFNYYEQYDWINVSIHEPNQFTMTSNCSWYYLDTDWIIWTGEICFPFFIDPELLQTPIDDIENYTYEIDIIEDDIKEVFGVDRRITIVRMEKTLIDESMLVFHYLQFDKETGVLIEWKIVDQNTLNSAFTLISVQETNLWQEEAISDQWKITTLAIGITVFLGVTAFIAFALYKRNRAMHFSH